MQSKRLRKYLEARKKGGGRDHNSSIKTDKKTDQDFPGYPQGTATEEIITPATKTQRKTAAVNTKDGEKITEKKVKKSPIREDESDGSASAFEGTERPTD